MDDSYCDATPASGAGAPERRAAEGPYAACVLCQEPTEYPESTKGITLCPVCEWREAERTACSG
ncbi:hypothetical protein ACIRD2_19535 [Streptomyces sp. NPDC093595]|jgi:hypothetical protein|uniref:hypothetical protein n=1 Tax=unclassified Streptomyces TaxID=2593676 RepID=UPI0037923E78